MLESLFNFILKIFFWLIGLIGSIVIYPVQALLVTVVPSLGEYLQSFLNWTATDVFPMLSFVKELFLQISCCPRPLFLLLINTLFARWLLAPAIRSIMLIINIWKIKSGGKTE